MALVTPFTRLTKSRYFWVKTVLPTCHSFSWPKKPHAGLTCQDLIAKTPVWCRVLALPANCFLYIALVGLIPIFHVLRDPLDCFQNPTKTTFDLVKYSIAGSAHLLIVAVRQLQTTFLSSGLPLDSNAPLEFFGRHVQKRILDRGISFRVVDRQSYPLLVRQ